MKPTSLLLGFLAVAGSSLFHSPHAHAQTTTTYSGANGAYNSDTWNTLARWSSGVPIGAAPSAPWDVQIADGWHAGVASNTTMAYTGNLTLGVGSTITIGEGSGVNGLNALGSGSITMKSGSHIVLRHNVNSVHTQSLVLSGNAKLSIGSSTAAHHETRQWNGEISGAGLLTIHSTNNQALLLNHNNSSWSGGLYAGGAESENKNERIRAQVAGSFGTGNVTIDTGVSLYFDANSVMGTGARLSLNGAKSSTAGDTAKLLLATATNTGINQFYVNAVKQIGGVYSSSSGLVDSGGANLIGGSGTLTVAGTAAYWNPSPGPGGTWDGSAIWDDQADLAGTDSAWVAGRTARFNTAGTYGVTVSGTQDVGGLGFDLGNVSFSGDGLRLVDNAPVFVATGASATIGSTLSQDSAGRELHKSGAGALTVSGSGNSYSGGTFVGAGTLNANSANALGTGAVTLVAGTLNLNAAQSVSNATVNGGTLRLAHANAVASATAVDVAAGGLTLELRGDTATTFAGAPVNFTPTANTQSFTINVDNNGSGTGNEHVLNGGFNRRVNVNQNTAANGMTLNVTGANGYSLSIPTVNLTGGMSTTFNPTTANLSIGTLTATTGTTAFGTANNIVLTLGGGAGSSNSINSITETSGAGQQLIINKNTAATWTLGNVNVKTGNGHTVSAGILKLNGTFEWTSTNTDRVITLSGGELHLNNIAALKTLNGNFRITGGSLDNSSGTAITNSTHNPKMQWNGDFTFIGSNGADGNLNLGNGTVALSATRQVTVTNASTTLSVGGIISGSGFGLTKAGNGKLELAGNNSYNGTTTVSGGTLIITGAVASTSVIVDASLAGSGIMAAATISGSGSVNPGNSPGIMTASATNPTEGLDFNFELTSATPPTWSNAAASVNDVLRLTSATPFSAALGSSNVVGVYFNSVSVGDVFTGGFFTDSNSNFLSSVSSATFQYFVANPTGAVTYNGLKYDAYSGNPISVDTIQVASANFTGGTVTNGYVTQFTVAVPEPRAALLGAIGALLLLRRRR